MKTQEHSSLYQKIEKQTHRSAWNKGVNEYALELVEFLENEELWATKKNMLNGADNWDQFSYVGNALIYDCDIAERLCSPSELKRSKGGENNPNRSESWLDVQARALHQACNRVMREAKS